MRRLTLIFQFVFKDIVNLIIFLFTIFGGLIAYILFINQSDKAHEKHIEQLSRYFDFDSVNRTPSEKENFYLLKSRFLSCWLYKDNCYMKWYNKIPPDPQDGPAEFELLTKIKIENILHSKNYDTLMVLVGYVSEWDVAGKDKLYSFFQGMKVLVDSNNTWHFNSCYDGPVLMAKGDNISEIERDFKKDLVKSGCLTNKNQIIPSFFHIAFTKGFSPIPNQSD